MTASTISQVRSRFSWGPIGRYGLLLIVAVCVLYPVGMLVYGAFSTAPPGVPGSFTLQWFRDAYTTPGFFGVFYNSFVYSGVKLAFATVIGAGLAFLVSRTDMPGRRFVELMAPVPFFLPNILTAIAYAMLANPRNGLINQWARTLFGIDGPIVNIYSMGGMIFHATFGTSALVYLLTIGAFKSLGSETEEAARVAGASRSVVIRTIVTPMVLPALSGAVLLMFIRGLESFESPLLLGRPAGIYVFSTEIYRYLAYSSPVRYGSATAVALVLVGLTLLLTLAQWRLVGRKSYVSVGGRGHATTRMRLGGWRWAAVGGVALYLLFGVVLPVAVLVAGSFSQLFGQFVIDGWTLHHWSNVAGNSLIRRSFRNTMVIAFVAGGMCVAIAGLIGYIRARTRWWGGKALDLLSWLPWTLPGLVLSLGFLWAAIFMPTSINLYGTTTLLMIAFVVNGLPLGARIMSGTIVQISPELEEAARTSGATWGQSFRHVTLRLVRVGFVAGWVVIAYGVIGNLSLPALLSAPGTEVLSVALLRLWSEGGSTSAVSVVAVIVLISVLALTALERSLRREEGAKRRSWTTIPQRVRRIPAVLKGAKQ